jgi:hypothetical protein
MFDEDKVIAVRLAVSIRPLRPILRPMLRPVLGREVA